MIPFGGFVFHLLYCIFMSFFLLATWLGRSYFLIRDWTTPPTEEAWHTNQWTARQVPHMPSFVRFPFKIFAQLKNLVICIFILIHIFGWGMWYKYFVPVCGLTFWFLNGPLRKVLIVMKSNLSIFYDLCFWFYLKNSCLPKITGDFSTVIFF